MVLSLSGPPINPTMQSAPGLFWFLTPSCNGSIVANCFKVNTKQLFGDILCSNLKLLSVIIKE